MKEVMHKKMLWIILPNIPLANQIHLEDEWNDPLEGTSQ